MLLVPMYLPVLGVAQILGLANNLVSHLGYELYQRWYNRIAPFRYLSTATYHSLHHTKLKGNYGPFFRVWDMWLGTEVGYDEAFLERGTRGGTQGALDEASPR